jgi:hypothetical protein
MGIGAGIFLVAVGAILAFAINPGTGGGFINVHTVGWILMIVGAVGTILSMIFWSSWGSRPFRRRTYMDEPPYR